MKTLDEYILRDTDIKMVVPLFPNGLIRIVAIVGACAQGASLRASARAGDERV